MDLARDDQPPPVDAVADVTARGTLHWAPLHHPGLLRRHQQVLTWLDEARPRLLVVDVSVEVALLARLCGAPVVVGAMPGERTDRPHTLAYDLAEAILAPWPEDAHPDAGWPQRWLDKTWHVGGISALQPAATRDPSTPSPEPSTTYEPSTPSPTRGPSTPSPTASWAPAAGSSWCSATRGPRPGTSRRG